MQMIDDQNETAEAFESIEYSDGNGDPTMAGWYILLLDGDGDVYDEIGPFDTQEEAEGVQDMMAFDVAA
jgi:hypothetical protein